MMTMAKNLSMLLVLAATGNSQCTFKDYGLSATYEKCPSGSSSTYQLGFFCKQREYTVENCWGFGGAPGCSSGDIEVKKESCGWWGEKRTCADISVDWGCGCGNTGRSCGCQCRPLEGRRSEVQQPKEVSEEPQQQRSSLEELVLAVVGDVGGVDSEVMTEWIASLRPESVDYLDTLMMTKEAGESEDENAGESEDENQ